MTLPNFMVIGAAKSGTTALYHYLSQHPQIYMSPAKEPNFFVLEGEKLDFAGPGDPINRWSVTDLESYCALFRGVTTEKAIGEASPLYLYDPRAPTRIHHYIPDAKLIAVLRNPVERAYATFCFLIDHARETCDDFTAALEQEETRIRQKWEYIWHYKQLGFYYTQLRRYFDMFDREQIRIYLYEDFQANNGAVLQDIFQFLEVDHEFAPDTSQKYRVSAIPKNRRLHALLVKPNSIKSVLRPLLPGDLPGRLKTAIMSRNLYKPTLSPEVREDLIQLYKDDILRLQELIQRDLSAWLK